HPSLSRLPSLCSTTPPPPAPPPLPLPAPLPISRRRGPLRAPPPLPAQDAGRRRGRPPPPPRRPHRRGHRPPRGGDPELPRPRPRSEEHTSELQSLTNLVCRLLLEKKKQ